MRSSLAQKMPSSRHYSYGQSARPWKNIATYFRELADTHERLQPMAALAEAIAESIFATEGLHGLTSMYDLHMSQSRDICGNPHLRIHWDIKNQQFEFTYEDGTLKPWNRVCERSEVFDVLERFLTKRARWFYRAEPTKQSG